MKLLTANEAAQDRPFDDKIVWCEADQIANDIDFMRRRLQPVRHMFKDLCELRHAESVMVTMGLPIRPEITARLEQLARQINRTLKDNK